RHRRDLEGDRALPPDRRGFDRLQVHDRRSEDVHQTVDGIAADGKDRGADLRVRVPRRQLRDDEHPRRRARPGKKGRRGSGEEEAAVRAMLVLALAGAALLSYRPAATIAEGPDVRFEHWEVPQGTRPFVPHDPAAGADGSGWYTAFGANTL